VEAGHKGFRNICKNTFLLQKFVVYNKDFQKEITKESEMKKPLTIVCIIVESL